MPKRSSSKQSNNNNNNKSINQQQATVEDAVDQDYILPVTQEIGEPPHQPTNDALTKAANLIKQQNQINKLNKNKPNINNNQSPPNDSKSKKQFEGLGLILQPNITRVVFKRTRNDMIVIQNPEVYKSSISDVYIVYGQATIQKNPMPNLNFKNPNQMLAKAGLNTPAAQARALKQLQDAASNMDDHDPDDMLPEVEDLVLDDTAPNPIGVSDKEITMVMKQSGVNRGKAISAINKNNGDIAAAIMSLTE